MCRLIEVIHIAWGLIKFLRIGTYINKNEKLTKHPTFHLSAHFLENSAKITFSSGCFFLCSSLQVCTKKAYAVMRPLGLASAFARGILPLVTCGCCKARCCCCCCCNCCWCTCCCTCCCWCWCCCWAWCWACCCTCWLCWFCCYNENNAL